MAAKPGRITEEIINAEYQAVYHYILSLGGELPRREQLLFMVVLYRQKYLDRQMPAFRQDPV